MNTVRHLTLHHIFLTLSLTLLSGCALLHSTSTPQAAAPTPHKHPPDKTKIPIRADV